MKSGRKETVILAFEPDGIKSEFKKGTRILDALRKVGLNIRSECGGREVCGKCRVIVQEPRVTLWSRRKTSERFS